MKLLLATESQTRWDLGLYKFLSFFNNNFHLFSPISISFVISLSLTFGRKFLVLLDLFIFYNIFIMNIILATASRGYTGKVKRVICTVYCAIIVLLHNLVCNNSIICIVYCAIIVLLHSLLCNNSIIAQFTVQNDIISFAIGKMITQPTLTPPQTRDWRRAIVCAEIVSRGRHMTKQLWE